MSGYRVQVALCALQSGSDLIGQRVPELSPFRIRWSLSCRGAEQPLSCYSSAHLHSCRLRPACSQRRQLSRGHPLCATRPARSRRRISAQSLLHRERLAHGRLRFRMGRLAPAWSKVQPEIAKWTRACSYDRAGTGFSEPGPMPRTSVHIAEELRTALHFAGIGGPYILVGSAFGGDNVRTFADLYMDEVAGLVLVDSDPDDLEPEAMREEAHRGHTGIPSDLRDCRNAIAEHKPLPVTSDHGQPQRTCAQQFFFGVCRKRSGLQN
jgi:hypothetical protein